MIAELENMTREEFKRIQWAEATYENSKTKLKGKFITNILNLEVLNVISKAFALVVLLKRDANYGNVEDFCEYVNTKTYEGPKYYTLTSEEFTDLLIKLEI